MPTSFLLRAVILPAIEQFTRARFWSNLAESARFERRGAEARSAVRARRLGAVLNHALRSPFHRQRLEKAGLPAAPCRAEDAGAVLAALAPVSKAELRPHFPDGLTTARGDADWRYFSTSGTTDRLTVMADFAKRDYVRSSELRALRVAMNADVGVRAVEIPPNACSAVCGLAEVGPPTFLGYIWHALRAGALFTSETKAGIRGRFERRVMHCRETLAPIEPAAAPHLADVLDTCLTQIETARPVLLRAFPLYLLWLADRARQTGRARAEGLRLVGPFGGLTSDRMADRIRAGLGAPFANIYGTSELGVTAASCGRGPGMHLFEDLFIVEVFQRGRPAAPGQAGRLVVTDLINTAMPLVRYAVGDFGRLHTGPCPCGRQTARLEVLGRSEEVLDTPHGPLGPAAVADSFFCDPAISNFRLEEVAPGAFEAAVVAGPSQAPDLEDWRERFAALHGGARRVRARAVPFVRPETSGKYRFVRPFTREAALL